MRGTLIFILLILLSYCDGAAQTVYRKGLVFDDTTYAAVPRKVKVSRGLEIVPSSASLKEYTPIPLSQGDYGTCTSWAVAYCGRTILDAVSNGWTDPALISKYSYSAQFLFRLLKPYDSICEGGSSIAQAFEILKEQGAIREGNTQGLCLPTVSSEQLAEASEARIKDYMRLFDLDAEPELIIQTVRKSIAEKKPVIIGLNCPDSFMSCEEVWEPDEDPNYNYGGHAICVIGYDDDKYGGAFEIQNSWGTDWGSNGYTWIKYSDFALFTKYAFQFVDFPEPLQNKPDLSGDIKLLLADGDLMAVNKVGSIYKTADSYTFGTRFRILICNNQPAYVYAISTDLSNVITKIFPYSEEISAALTDRQNEVPIPDEDHYIQFDNNPGTDILCVLYSRDELNLDEIVRRLYLSEGTFSEKIYEVLGRHLVDSKNIAYSDNAISFRGFSNGQSVIPLIVEMQHH